MDAYDRTARLYPALLVAAPFTLLALLLLTVPGAWQKAATLIAAGGLHVLLVQLVRDRGLAAQVTLWADWGGPPSTRLLRWRTATNPVLHQRRHTDVQNATGTPLPTEAEENADPVAADHTYETAVAVLRQQTRDGEAFRLVQSENANYGFRRNLYGCKPLGITLALIAATAEATLGVLALTGGLGISAPAMFVAAAVSLASAVVWQRWVTAEFVKTAADKYAEELISSAATVS